MKNNLTISQQLALLIEHGVDANNRAYALSELAERSGIRYQTLANLRDGKSNNPRLKTLQALCQIYGVSLDYFTCETESECLAILRQRRVSSIVRSIDAAVTALSEKGQRNVLTMMSWLSLKLR